MGGGDPATRPLPGAFLSDVKENMLRFPFQSRPFHLNLLGWKGRRSKVLSEYLVLINWLKINIPKGTVWWGVNFGPLQSTCKDSAMWVMLLFMFSKWGKDRQGLSKLLKAAVYHGAPRNRYIVILITVLKMKKWKLKDMNCSEEL